jgi:hypothetical protein
MKRGIMTKAVWTTMAAAALLAVAAPVGAQSATDSASVLVTATLNAKAKLTLSAASVTFADANPDLTPLLSATAINVTVKARTSAAGNITLTAVADHDLQSGSDTIPIANLTWIVGGAGFTAGTMDAVTAHNVGSWVGSGNYAGTQTLKLVNDWAYNTGSYTATISYTLTAP